MSLIYKTYNANFFEYTSRFIPINEIYCPYVIHNIRITDCENIDHIYVSYNGTILATEKLTDDDRKKNIYDFRSFKNMILTDNDFSVKIYGIDGCELNKKLYTQLILTLESIDLDKYLSKYFVGSPDPVNGSIPFQFLTNGSDAVFYNRDEYEEYIPLFMMSGEHHNIVCNEKPISFYRLKKYPDINEMYTRNEPENEIPITYQEKNGLYYISGKFYFNGCAGIRFQKGKNKLQIFGDPVIMVSGKWCPELPYRLCNLNFAFI